MRKFFAVIITILCFIALFSLSNELGQVVALDDYKLLVIFAEGVNKMYDVTPLFEKFIIFNDLKENGLFYECIVDVGGYGVSWNDNIDLSCDELFNNGKTKENLRLKLTSKVIDEYSLLTNNCTTISIDAVNYADGDIPKSSSIVIMPYDQIQTMNINIFKPSQLNNQLNINPNVNKVEDSYRFLINLVNDLNTENR